MSPSTGCPTSSADHAPYAKRAMASDMAGVMERLGFSRFAVAGHDRGGRVAYRLALDHPDRVPKLAVLDVVPTSMVWSRADADLWRQWADKVSGEAFDGGHFFPEELPQQTADALARFLLMDQNSFN